LTGLYTPKTRPPDREDIVSVREKLGRSPDTADAVVYLWHAVRILHNLNDYFQHFAAPLAVYPSPDANPADLAMPKAGEQKNQTLEWLRQQYGHLVGKGDAPPEDAREKMKQFRRQLESEQVKRENQQRDEKLDGEAAEAGLSEEEKEQRERDKNHWLNKVKWADE
jgi:hypothetical protein